MTLFEKTIPKRDWGTPYPREEAYNQVHQVDEEQSPIPRGTPMNKRWPYISNKDPEFQTALDRVNKKKSKKKNVSAESYDIGEYE